MAFTIFVHLDGRGCARFNAGGGVFGWKNTSVIASDTAENGIHAAVPAKLGKDPMATEDLTSKGSQSVVAQ
jgi:hypothetical protein